MSFLIPICDILYFMIQLLSSNYMTKNCTFDNYFIPGYISLSKKINICSSPDKCYYWWPSRYKPNALKFYYRLFLYYPHRVNLIILSHFYAGPVSPILYLIRNHCYATIYSYNSYGDKDI